MASTLTLLGLVHTLLSVIAIVAGALTLWRQGLIQWANRGGQLYVVMTALSCLTGLLIFRHGGFGPPHALALITLITLAVGLGAERRRWFGAWSGYVAIVAMSTTFFFHSIPGFNETFTRLPLGAPWLSGPDDPLLGKLVGGAFVLLLIGLTLQLRRLRARLRLGAALRGAAV
ncbi:hypothetical protein [Roseateles amylovorans]|uniref:DUF2306 domain-containing protein n=1 Tax=Roseateles amylovorans TaxID=2978473 RepID=A0ABY6B1M1_9BURK|nr:hypothetical protein [Roseateles amylovorans]UXH78955.1 hypothetical protein N4261_03175 [Roseateles amylovorans]